MDREAKQNNASGESGNGRHSPNHKRSTARLRDWAIRILFVLVLIVFAIPDFREAQIRAKVSRVRSDMRSFAFMLESYHTNHGFYPAWSTGMTSLNGAYFDHPDLRRMPTIRIDPGMREPFAISEEGWEPLYYPADPFAPVERARYVYYTSGDKDAIRWFIASAGPDRDYDIDPATVFGPPANNPSISLSELTYDPTNGVTSNGDIWQVSKAR